MGLDVLFWIVLLTWMAKRSTEDVLYAVKGQVPPRHRERMERIKRGESQARYGVRGWLDDATEDFLRANTQWRRSRAARKAAEKLEVPLDDMVDVAGVRPRPVHPNDPNNTRNCPVCKGEVVLDGRPCPRCLEEQQRRNAEHDASLCPVCLVTSVPAGQQCPTCAFWRESDEANQRKLDEQDAAISRVQETASRTLADRDPDMWERTHVNDDVDLTADDVLPNLLAGPAGAGHPNCDRCLEFYRVENGRMVCGCTRASSGESVPDGQFLRHLRGEWCGDPNCDCACKQCLKVLDRPGRNLCDECLRTPATQPLAPVIPLFPSITSVEKEISMSEVHGLSTAIAYADAIANTHQSFTTAGAEGYIGALERGGNSGEVITSAREAMEASGVAADKWAAHKAILAKQMNLKEGYADNPDAADKDFLLNG